uniref:Uncharacterized protein n=1 Tax=Usnea subgracilis TaxID=2250278 RepID=A0A482G5K9_9LECA|nr:hypothetical protein [Usnea subgracilis]
MKLYMLVSHSSTPCKDRHSYLFCHTHSAVTPLLAKHASRMLTCSWPFGCILTTDEDVDLLLPPHQQRGLPASQDDVDLLLALHQQGRLPPPCWRSMHRGCRLALGPSSALSPKVWCPALGPSSTRGGSLLRKTIWWPALGPSAACFARRCRPALGSSAATGDVDLLLALRLPMRFMLDALLFSSPCCYIH